MSTFPRIQKRGTTIQALPAEMIQHVLSFCTPGTYVNALEATQLFHPIAPEQYRCQKEQYEAEQREKRKTAVRSKLEETFNNFDETMVEKFDPRFPLCFASLIAFFY